MVERSGKKLIITIDKARKMFKLILLLDSDKLVSNRLNISQTSFINAKRRGRELEEKFDKVLEYCGLYDYEIEDNYFDLFEAIRPEIEQKFIEEFNIFLDDGKIPIKYSRQFKHYLKKQEIVYLEEYVFNKELEILNKIEFTKNKTLDEDIKVYLMFYRTYKRAKCALEEDYLMKYKEVLTDPKNIKELRSRLNKLDKEEFAEEPVDKTVNHNHKISLIEGLLEYEKTKQLSNNKPLLEDKSNNDLIIDVEYDEIIEEDEETEIDL